MFANTPLPSTNTQPAIVSEPVKLLELTQAQQTILVELLAGYIQQLANWQFNDPANDQLYIRQHAALSGKKEAIQEILTFDTRAVEQETQDAESYFSTANFNL